MADVLDTRLQQAQTEQMAPIDLVAALVNDELQRRQDRLLARRHKQARFRDPDRALVFELTTARFVAQREDALFLGPPGTGKSTLPRPSDAPPSSRATASSTARRTPSSRNSPRPRLADTRKAYLAELTRVPLLIIDDLGMRKLPHTAAEDLLELIMRRYERASTLLTSNRPVDDWGKLLGDTAAVTALLDRRSITRRASAGRAAGAQVGPNIRGWVDHRWAPPRVATRRAACQRAARVLRLRFGPAG